MKLTAAALIALATAGSAHSQAPVIAVGPKVRHVIGLDTVKRNATGTLLVQDGSLNFKTDTADNKVPVASIDDIFIGTETTQSGGKTGRVVKTMAMAAPYESGKALTILMRTKVDILTVAFHDPSGGLHGAIFALPIGQADLIRMQLTQAGAHASSTENQLSERSKP